METKSEQLQAVTDARVLAVVRAPSPEVALEACRALVRGGIAGLEITYSTPDAPRVIRELTTEFASGVIVGAGTITTEAQAQEAAEAGARFLVSPGTRENVVRAMTGTGLLTMSGAFTPTEVMAAIDCGADVVKVFPASLGGPALLKALAAPFPNVPFMPTGGVNPGNLAEWFSAGAIAVGAGGDLVPSSALASGNMERIESLARVFSEKSAR